jgi:hypothetical protein
MLPVQPQPHGAGGDEYDGVTAPPLAPLLALLCFVAALGSRFLVEVIPPELRPMPRPFLSALVTPAFAIVGAALAMLGLRSRSRGLARIALGLNAIVLLLSLLAIAAFVAIYPAAMRTLFGL